MEQRAELLRKLMDEKNMKVADIVRISGVPYSTVKAILERGAEKAGYVNVCKICSALGISADELEKMVKDQNNESSTIEVHFNNEYLVGDEFEFIRKYRTLDDDGKEIIDIILEREYKRVIKKKNQNPDQYVIDPEDADKITTIRDLMTRQKHLSSANKINEPISYIQYQPSNNRSIVAEKLVPYTTNAANFRTDIEVPEGADTSDNDIMDSESF